MSNSSSKGETMMKPVLIKAGIPLAISIAGFIYATFISTTSKSFSSENRENSTENRENLSKNREKLSENRENLSENRENLSENNSREEGEEREDVRDDESFRGVSSTTSSSFEHEEEEEHITTMSSIRNSRTRDIDSLNRFVFGLKTVIEDLRKRESEFEVRFRRFRDLEQQETVFSELKNMLSLLRNDFIEFSKRSMKSVDVDNLVGRYERVVELVGDLRSNKRLLEGKVKRLLRKMRDRSRVIREKNLRIEDREEQVSRCLEEQETLSNVVKKLEMEVEELRSIVDRLEEQKHELSSKLELTEKSVAMNFKIEEESITITTDEYKQIVEEYESVQKNRALEIKELIYLRWSNACLRHELMRTRLRAEHNDKDKNTNIQDNNTNIHSEHDLEEYDDFEDDGIKPRTGGDLVWEKDGESCFETPIGKKRVWSKRRKLVEKFKKWVEGSEKTKRFEKEKHEIKCFGRHSDYSYRVEDQEHVVVLPRNSFSSA